MLSLSVRLMRMTARSVLGLLQLVPAVALILAVCFDRGPAGEPRFSPHAFPVVLWIFDDFAWTCARNSVLFALVISLASLLIGVGLGWLLVRRRFWGRPVLHAAVLTVLAAPPAFVALGMLGLIGPPHPWPWPVAARSTEGPGGPGASLESWAGLPLWIMWVWTTLPAAAAFVAFSATAAIERLERSWEDAARLAGASRFRIWLNLSWPVIRPAVLRATALVFLFTVAEPGAPLILGLRRTLAFQIVSAAGRSDPFPGVAVWAIMAGLYGFIGWLFFNWRAGPPIVAGRQTSVAAFSNGRQTRRATSLSAFVSTLVLAVWAIVGWLPILGLVPLVAGSAAASTAGGAGVLLEHARRIALPPVPQLATNSLVFGFAVACTLPVLAWMRRPDDDMPVARAALRRFMRAITQVPPLVLGAGMLALPWLAELASRFLLEQGHSAPALFLEHVARSIDPYRNSWILMACCLLLVLAPLDFSGWRANPPPALGPKPAKSNSGFETALAAGATRARARWLSAHLRPGRWVGRFVLVWVLAATNLTPSLLFVPWSDSRTVAPAALVLAGGDAESRSQAAALALGVVAANIGALGLARFTEKPRCDDLE
jgi:iron(III) transport system permease protein